MSYLIIIILAIIQGAAEFLPVSSSGHLIVFYNFFGIHNNTILLSIILHLATLLVVVIVYRKQLWWLVKNPLCKTNKLIFVSTIITVGMVLIFRNFIENSFSGDVVLLCFVATAVILVFAELINKRHTLQQNVPTTSATSGGFLAKSEVCNIKINYKQALIIGFSQGVATLPGISRSGATIAAGLVSGVKKEDAANYSFLLSVPIIIASFVYELFKLPKQNFAFEFNVWQLLVGFVVAFAVGLLCLRAMLTYVKKQKLYVFSIYLLALVVFLLLNKYVLFWL